MTRRSMLSCFLLVAGVVSSGSRAALPETSCVRCHSDAGIFPPERIELVQAYAQDIHGSAGLSCHDCHGGNPDPALSEDAAAAMDGDFRANPYRGLPKRPELPSFCGSCHSDPEYMKRFRPDLRIDQEQEYWTSRHGVALKAGDEDVATCVDCHGVHGIRSVKDVESRVFPANVSSTCAGCHGDPDRMGGHKLNDGSPLPVNQVAMWEKSVHGRAMIERQDLSAPTCNDCHGNHGAVPPGVESVSFVCGQCHAREASLFRASAKREGFSRHTQLLADNEGAQCSTCHDLPESLARIETWQSLTECTTCHGNHDVARPSTAMLGLLEEAPCDTCHGTATGQNPDALAVSDRTELFEESRNRLVLEGRGLGLSGNELYGWLVERAWEVPQHHTGESAGKSKTGFAYLFEKFRIGSPGPGSKEAAGGKAGARIQCLHCHSEPDSPGNQTAVEMLRKINRLTGTTAAAERAILRARRGGVETRQALANIEKAVASGIELQVLVHGFDVAEEGRFSLKFREGLASAEQALAAGNQALKELASRRQGLLVALCFIALVLLGLFLKIRQVG